MHWLGMALSSRLPWSWPGAGGRGHGGAGRRYRKPVATHFEERDRTVMSCAYASQNELGRLCDECVYEKDMVIRLRAAGCHEIHTQVPLTVSHRDFAKTYRLDLIVDDALYELKTVNDLAGEHEAQLLNYMLLLEIGRAN